MLVRSHVEPVEIGAKALNSNVLFVYIKLKSVLKYLVLKMGKRMTEFIVLEVNRM